VWLTVMADESECRELQETGPLRGENWSTERPGALPDPLLRPDLEWYRLRLHETTSLAFDLLADEKLALNQKFLPKQAREGSPCGELLARHLDEHSATHRSWSRQQLAGYWTDFYRIDRDGSLSYPGHWLWNLAG
jgi:hypothetical protein